MKDESQTLNRELLRAVEREQKITAQEMHGSICQTLAGAALLVSTALRSLEKGKSVKLQEMARIKSVLAEGLEQVNVLQQSYALSIKPDNLAKALLALASSNKVVKCNCEAGAVKIQDALVAQAIYRVAREVLLDFARTGNDALVKMHLRMEGPKVVFEVSYPQGEETAAPVYDSDAILQLYTETSGLDWNVQEDRYHSYTLRVSTRD